MFELSHPERLRMLNILKEKPMRLSEMSKLLDVTTAEVSRHMERLVKAKLTERNHDNCYKITPFAAIILSEYSKFDYLTQNVDFFLNHDFTVLPPELHWFTSMAEGELIEGTLEITSLFWEYHQEAKKYINVISDQIMRGIVDLNSKKIDNGVVVKKIYPNDVEIPQKYLSRIHNIHEIRTLEEIPLALIITDKNAAVILRGKNKKVDFSMGMVGENAVFRRWISAIFNYFWNEAKPIL
jgi:predicted transcriptional regulator